jgi:hypothetical protein
MTIDEFRSDGRKMLMEEKGKYWENKRKYSPSVTCTRVFSPGLYSYKPAMGSLNSDKGFKFELGNTLTHRQQTVN